MELRIKIFARENPKKRYDHSNCSLLDVKSFIEKFNKFEKTNEKKKIIHTNVDKSIYSSNSIKLKEPSFTKSNSITKNLKPFNRSKTISKFNILNITKHNSIFIESSIKEIHNDSISFENINNGTKELGSNSIYGVNDKSLHLSLPRFKEKESSISLYSQNGKQLKNKMKKELSSNGIKSPRIDVQKNRGKKGFVITNPSYVLKMNSQDQEFLHCIINNKFAYAFISFSFENYFSNSKIDSKIALLHNLIHLKKTEKLFLLLSDSSLNDKLKGKYFELLTKKNQKSNDFLEKFYIKIHSFKKIDFIN